MCLAFLPLPGDSGLAPERRARVLSLGRRCEGTRSPTRLVVPDRLWTTAEILNHDWEREAACEQKRVYPHPGQMREV